MNLPGRAFDLRQIAEPCIHARRYKPRHEIRIASPTRRQATALSNSGRSEAVPDATSTNRSTSRQPPPFTEGRDRLGLRVEAEARGALACLCRPASKTRTDHPTLSQPLTFGATLVRCHERNGLAWR
jgi:hypothetical protein